MGHRSFSCLPSHDKTTSMFLLVGVPGQDYIFLSRDEKSLGFVCIQCHMASDQSQSHFIFHAHVVQV